MAEIKLDLRSATIIVAANNSLHRNMAEYVCDGVADDIEINAALAAAAGGRVFLLEGIYNCIANLVSPADTKLEGEGWGTILNFDDGGAGTVTDAGAITINGDNVHVFNLKAQLAAGCGAAGTRPNIIRATSHDRVFLKNLWLVGDETVDDANDQRQNGMVFYTVHYAKVVNCLIQDNKRNGIWCRGCDDSLFSGNTLYSNGYIGIYENWSGHHNEVIGNHISYNGVNGIYLYANPTLWDIAGNHIHDNVGHGIYIRGNVAPNYHKIRGNTIEGQTGGAQAGIHLFRSSYCVISGNQCLANPGDGIHIVGDATANCDHNVVVGNVCSANGSHGIEVAGGAFANSNLIKDNKLTGNTTAPFADGGLNTHLAAYVVPFSEGSDPQDSGYLIDLAGEFARAWLRLPPEVQQVVRMRIYARAVILSAAAMRLEINANGGADNEPFNIHATAAPNTPSISTSFAADDVIYWELTMAQIVALLGGDSVEVKVLHEAAGNGDVGTDAYLRTVEFEYV